MKLIIVYYNRCFSLVYKSIILFVYIEGKKCIYSSQESVNFIVAIRVYICVKMFDISFIKITYSYYNNNK